MNDSSYTILIPALLLLSAAMVAMLYARFAFRSRENSDEIDLVDIDLAMSRISAAERVDGSSTADDTERVPFLDPRPGLSPILEVASSGEKAVDEPENDESEYFDELQEAAAGLAALMRSSPVGKSTPVVYAPDDLEEETADKADAVNAVASEDDPQEILMPVSELVSGDSDAVEKVTDADVEAEADALGEDPTAPIPLEELEEALVEIANVVVENSTVTETVAEIDSSEPENEVLSLRALLGNDVAEQFDSIDDGLSDLENLVVSIESALSSLNDGLEEVVTEDESEAVSEAA